jgi:5'-3' exonuclease
LQYLPVTIWKSNDYEADDVIYTLCQNLKDEEVTVLSNDSDFIQLLQEFKHVNIYNPIKKIYMEAPVYHYGIWKSLAGDKSDNIPKLISDKKAQNLAGNPDLLKNYLENEEFRSNFSINYELIKFKSIDFSEINTVVGVASYDKLFDKFKEFEFNSITNDKSREKFISTFGDL